MKNYKRNMAVMLASSIVFANSQSIITYALNKEEVQQNICANKNNKEETIIPMDSELVNKPEITLFKELKVAPERPYVTGISKSEISIGSYYRAEASITGQARKGSTVYAKLGNQQTSYKVDENERFGFNISTSSRDIVVELYTVNYKGETSESTYVRLTSNGDYITNNGTTPTPNTIPNIVANDITIRPDVHFNPLEYVKAVDNEDGDITPNIQVVENTVDTSKIGEYKVKYAVTDSDDNTAIKEIKVTVGNNEKPNIVANDIILKVGDVFDPKKEIKANDKEDGDITSKVIVKENTVNTSKPGVYKVVYEVTDSEKSTVTEEIKVTVKDVFTMFTVNSINNKSTEISGKGVDGATVKVFVGSKQIGNTATVNSSENYKITIPAQSANTSVIVKMNKSGYETAHKTIKVNEIATNYNKSLTKDINKYDAGSGKYLTHINGKGYSQYSYLNTSGKYAFTPSSWMVAAGLNVTMPASSNGYTMMIDNNYITMYNQSSELLNNIKAGNIAKRDIAKELDKIEKLKTQDLTVQQDANISSKAALKKTLTKDIYKYDAGSGKYLTYINGKGYSQYSYLNTAGSYAFTPSSWMSAAGLNVTMPTSENGYSMKVDNPYIKMYDDTVKELEKYM